MITQLGSNFLMLYRENQHNWAMMSTWTLKVNWSSIMKHKFLIAFAGMTRADWSVILICCCCIARLAEMTRSSVWEWLSWTHAKISARHDEYHAETVKASTGNDRKSCVSSALQCRIMGEDDCTSWGGRNGDPCTVSVPNRIGYGWKSRVIRMAV